MAKITVFEVTNPDALDVPEFEEFARRVIKAYPFATVDLEDALSDLIMLITDPTVNVLAAVEGTEFKGMAILVHQTDQFSPVPQVAHFHNEGRPKVKRELVNRVVEIVKDKGYNKFWAVNATATADSVWARAFHRAGKSNKIGSIMEFEVE